MRDEINDPLGSDPKSKSGSGHLGAVAAGLALTAVAAAAFGAARWGLADFGRPAPLAVARIEAAAPAPSPASTISEVAASGTSAFASGAQIEKASGVKVTRNGGGGPPGALIIDVPQALGVRLAAAPDPRLVEKSKFGDLPRVGADGSRPADVYARPIAESVKLRNAPRVAILVGGLGIDAGVTHAAISQLPSGISLGFAPYGDSLRELAASARDAGHEILLQAPMEGFGAQTAGPHTLMTGAAEPENRDSLKWMMARFPGFVGVSNYLGAKFTSDTHAFAPVLAELGSRGLLYLDDGSSPRSLTASLAPGVNLRAAQADVVIDASPTPEDIEIALSKLETIARRQGVAIGVATALPMSLEHIAHWADALEARGVALTPVSAAIGRNAMRSAQNP